MSATIHEFKRTPAEGSFDVAWIEYTKKVRMMRKSTAIAIILAQPFFSPRLKGKVYPPKPWPELPPLDDLERKHRAVFRITDQPFFM